MVTATKPAVKFESECSACRGRMNGWPEYCQYCGSGRLFYLKPVAGSPLMPFTAAQLAKAKKCAAAEKAAATRRHNAFLKAAAK